MGRRHADRRHHELPAGGVSRRQRALHLIERFKRVDADTLLYEFTVDDPVTWTRPWTVQFPMTRSREPIFEYACHEGNYSLPNILAGARAAEKSGR